MIIKKKIFILTWKSQNNIVFVKLTHYTPDLTDTKYHSEFCEVTCFIIKLYSIKNIYFQKSINALTTFAVKHFLTFLVK